MPVTVNGHAERGGTRKTHTEIFAMPAESESQLFALAKKRNVGSKVRWTNWRQHCGEEQSEERAELNSQAASQPASAFFESHTRGAFLSAATTRTNNLVLLGSFVYPNSSTHRTAPAAAVAASVNNVPGLLAKCLGR